MIPQHKAYCEVFAGASWVLFRKEPSQYETINDLDNDLVTFYRVVKAHPEEFLRQFKWILSSREIFEDYKSQIETAGWTDIQRAARYYYLQRHSFGGRTNQTRSFGFNVMKRPRINLLRLEEEISEVHLRLSSVNIEHRDWRDFIKFCDRGETFFYLDPPYWGRKDYRHNLKPEDYQEMAGLLSTIKGTFILSLDDRPEVRDVFKQFDIHPVSLTYTIGCRKDGTRKVGKEVLIKNY